MAAMSVINQLSQWSSHMSKPRKTLGEPDLSMLQLRVARRWGTCQAGGPMDQLKDQEEARAWLMECWAQQPGGPR